MKKLLCEFTVLGQELQLIEGKRVAVDGTKLKASNNVARVWNSELLAKKMASVEAEIDTYLRDCGEADAEIPQAEPLAKEQKIEQLQRDLAELKEREQELKESGKTVLPKTDPDCRALMKVGLGYNAQIAVDTAHHLIVAADLVDAPNDQKQLTNIAKHAREALGQSERERLQVVADAGYYDRVSLIAAEEANLEVFVPRPRKGRQPDNDRYHKDKFIYEAGADVYRCPNGAALKRETQTRRGGLMTFLYANPSACRQCPLRARCTRRKYRRVERCEKEDVLERVAARLAAAPEMMKVRSSVVEHPFGTIKFWNYQFAFLTRGFARVRTEFTFSVLAYNLKRLSRLIPVCELLSKLTQRRRSNTGLYPTIALLERLIRIIGMEPAPKRPSPIKEHSHAAADHGCAENFFSGAILLSSEFSHSLCTW
jgi:hypothetical protein